MIGNEVARRLLGGKALPSLRGGEGDYRFADDQPVENQREKAF
jgi:hypothetical protein